jgi:L-asparagine transporter-like permease
MQHKKKREFSKILAAWATVIATVTIAASVVLAVFDKQPVTDLSIAVFTACIGYLITYAGKSAYEKNSRNKHGLDEFGNPYEQPSGDMLDE